MGAAVLWDAKKIVGQRPPKHRRGVWVRLLVRNCAPGRDDGGGFLFTNETKKPGLIARALISGKADDQAAGL
jgi:hypothetical protein